MVKQEKRVLKSKFSGEQCRLKKRVWRLSSLGEGYRVTWCRAGVSAWETAARRSRRPFWMWNPLTLSSEDTWMHVLEHTPRLELFFFWFLPRILPGSSVFLMVLDSSFFFLAFFFFFFYKWWLCMTKYNKQKSDFYVNNY